MDDEWYENLWKGISFWIACDIRLDGHEDFLQAERLKDRCPGWARFLYRRAAKKEQIANLFCPVALQGNWPLLEDV